MMSSVRAIVTIAFLFFTFACNKTTTTTVDTSNTCTPLAVTSTNIGSANVVPVTVGCGYANEPCVAVKICVPGTTTCQTIDHILLDTGSYGLRLFNCVVGLNLPHKMVNSKELAECVAYADTTSDWGPVMLADIYLGSETTSTGPSSTGTPIQIIDPSYSPNLVNSGNCGTPEYSPQVSGFNGIMGIGMFQNDCPGCVNSSNISGTPFYAECSNGTCSASATPAIDQVANPISSLQGSDNNGTILEINNPTSFPASGTSGVTGSLVLGLDSGESNNNTTGTGLNIVNMYPADPQNGIFAAVYKGTEYPDSFVDSGSNLWDFPDASLNECTGSLDGSGIYCPSSTQNLSATPYMSYPGSPGPAVSFSIGSGNALLDGNNAFNNIGAYFGGLGITGPGPDSFDFGFPFFYGRYVCTGIMGKFDTTRSWGGSTLSPNPYWAWK